MAINAKNFGSGNTPKTKKSLGEVPRSQSKAFKRPKALKVEEKEQTTQLKANYRIERKEVKSASSTETALLVNGKQKSIGRKSHYLLDMLTLDDE